MHSCLEGIKAIRILKEVFFKSNATIFVLLLRTIAIQLENFLAWYLYKTFCYSRTIEMFLINQFRRKSIQNALLHLNGAYMAISEVVDMCMSLVPSWF